MWFNYQINDRKHGANIDHVFILLAGQVPQKGSEIWHKKLSVDHKIMPVHTMSIQRIL